MALQQLTAAPQHPSK